LGEAAVWHPSHGRYMALHDSSEHSCQSKRRRLDGLDTDPRLRDRARR
jgi:hypothetical protein